MASQCNLQVTHISPDKIHAFNGTTVKSTTDQKCQQKQNLWPCISMQLTEAKINTNHRNEHIQGT